MMNTLHTKKQGFVMLFTVLIVSVIMTLAIGIANIGYKQTILSSVAKDSQTAFYAADGGIECGLYLYVQGTFDGTMPQKIQCDTVELTRSGTGAYTMQNPPPGTTCFDLTVSKYGSNPSGYEASITSSGYNVCSQTSPRRLQRTLEVRF